MSTFEWGIKVNLVLTKVNASLSQGLLKQASLASCACCLLPLASCRLVSLNYSTFSLSKLKHVLTNLEHVFDALVALG